jgi:hypothetical protein
VTTIPHDLPPCPKAQVRKGLYSGQWRWHHKCLWHGHLAAQGGYTHWELAMKAAADHMAHCEAM